MVRVTILKPFLIHLHSGLHFWRFRTVGCSSVNQLTENALAYCIGEVFSKKYVWYMVVAEYILSMYSSSKNIIFFLCFFYASNFVKKFAETNLSSIIGKWYLKGDLSFVSTKVHFINNNDPSQEICSRWKQKKCNSYFRKLFQLHKALNKSMESSFSASLLIYLFGYQCRSKLRTKMGEKFCL